jgi:hypothetical protein
MKAQYEASPLVSTARCFVDGKEATEDDVKESPFTVASCGKTETSFHAFRTEDSFKSWIMGTGHKRQFIEIESTIEAVRKLEKQDHSRAQKVQKARGDWIQNQLDELARDTNLKPGSPDLIRRASTEAPLLEGPLLHTGICSENSDGTGNAVFLISALPVPDFRWFGMNDKASALTFWGGGVLTENIWYAGSNTFSKCYARMFVNKFQSWLCQATGLRPKPQ